MTELTSQDFSSEAFVMNMAVPCHFVVAMASGDNEERTNERTNGVIHTRLNKNSSIAVVARRPSLVEQTEEGAEAFLRWVDGWLNFIRQRSDVPSEQFLSLENGGKE